MLDPIQIPILLKAIDFVFDEGHKLLEERRERRKTSAVGAAGAASAASAPAQTGDAPEPTEATSAETQESSETKQDLLSSKIDEILWKNHEAEVQHLVRLLETYSRNYHLASEQYAKWGDALVPPIIVHNMTQAENSMGETLKKLEDVLSKVYKKDITPNQQA
ncbi:MAG TPA: hypothetical protein VFG81_09375 [Anaerolineales bacterium]|jgi:hypothetical protein|nr:hypothetical protein [Anaerolineales bacterium]